MNHGKIPEPREIVNEIGAWLTDFEIMEKHYFSAQELTDSPFNVSENGNREWEILEESW